MAKKSLANLSIEQVLFKDLFVGTLIYAVVLGFFNDYTDLVVAQSFSTIFLSSIVLQILTMLTFRLKEVVVRRTRTLFGENNKLAVGFSIWLIVFFSKFVYVWVVDAIFGDNMNFNGFIGILFVVAMVTLVSVLFDIIFAKLGRVNKQLS